jgi:hypothetical protein
MATEFSFSVPFESIPSSSSAPVQNPSESVPNSSSLNEESSNPYMEIVQAPCLFLSFWMGRIIKPRVAPWLWLSQPRTNSVSLMDPSRNHQILPDQHTVHGLDATPWFFHEF